MFWTVWLNGHVKEASFLTGHSVLLTLILERQTSFQIFFPSLAFNICNHTESNNDLKTSMCLFCNSNEEKKHIIVKVGVTCQTKALQQGVSAGWLFRFLIWLLHAYCVLTLGFNYCHIINSIVIHFDGLTSNAQSF